MGLAFQDDSGAPIFFLSYARARQPHAAVGPPTEVNRHVQRLFAELTSNVNQLIARAAGADPGFMDLALDGGARWRRTVLGAAASAQVFVSLLSAPYVNRSEWCAMEWDLFSRRPLVRRDGGPSADATNMVPVLWAPMEDDLPPAVGEIHRFEPSDMFSSDILPQYLKHGLYGLMAMKADASEVLIWMLALRLQRLYHTNWVEPVDFETVTDLRTSFVTGGPV